MKSPTTSTEQMLATASNGVSSTLTSTGFNSGRVPFGDLRAGTLATGDFFFVILSLVNSSQLSVGQFSVPESHCVCSFTDN